MALVRRLVPAALVVAVAALAVGLLASPRQATRPGTEPAAPNGGTGAGTVAPVAGAATAFVVRGAVASDLSAPLRTSRPALTPGRQRDAEEEQEDESIGERGLAAAPAVATKDPVLQPAGTVAATSVSSTVANFAGITNRNGVLPPDTTGDVGPNHYVQFVNLSLAIYSKTGTLLYGPTNGNTIWSGFAGTCSTRNDGDPIVLYDQAADRWMVSQFALPGGKSGYHQCIAVSQTGDPTGAWYRYDFLYSTTKMNDYPHFGVWPDGYYLTVNQFTGGTTWGGQGVAVFERSKMLAGQTARMVMFDLNSVDPNLGGMLPSDQDGATPPPTGAPNTFAEFDDDAWGYSPDQVQLWDFHVDWANTANSTFTKKAALPVAAFDSNMCAGARSCIPQAGTTVKLDSLADRLMYRLAYRNFGDHQALVMNHTVDVDGTDHAGIRWYELRSTGSGWSIFQQGTYAPDAAHRWVGSIAMNGAGGIGLGYSTSSSSTYASLRYTGRTAADPAGVMAQGEGTIISGTGAQTNTASRWGDYSTLSVDPVDDCTFWYTGEYVATTGSASWVTRIASFTLPDCSGAPVTTGTITGHVRDASSVAVTGATVTIAGGPTATTDATGTYTFAGLAAGSYDVTASKTGYTPATTTGVAVTAGASTTADLQIAVIPVSTTAWINPVTAAAVTTSAGDNNGYETGAANLLAIDGLLATDTNSGSGNGTSCTATNRDKEQFSGYAFSVPVGAAIKGIEVQLAAKASTTSGAPKLCVLLSWNGGTTWTTGKSTAALTTGLTTSTLGTSADLWGRTWLASELGTSTLRVRIVDLANSTKVTFSLDSVTVRVTYQ